MPLCARLNRACRFACAFFLFCPGLLPAQAQILHYADLTTTQVEHLDRTHTVILITDGIMEEHGPYLPTFVDGYWDEALARSLAASIAARPGWTVVLLPTLPLGTNPANVVGLRWSFPGSVTVRFETMRAVMMDLADALGEQGFRHVMIVDSHGGPTNSVALDAASDYFDDTYGAKDGSGSASGGGGEMVHLLGLMPIFECCNAMETSLTKPQIVANGMSIHADALEQSQGLYVRPDLVPPTFRSAPARGGADFPALMEIARQPGWPGYLGAPAYASRRLGARYFAQQSAAVNAMANRILDGKVSARTLPRYGAILFEQTRAVEDPMLAHEAEMAARHAAWLRQHGSPK